MDQKQEFRDEFIRRRKALSLADKAKLDFKLNESVSDLLSMMNLTAESKILAYFPMEDMKEVDLIMTLDTLLENGMNLYFPRVTGGQRETLEIVKVNSWDDFTEGKFGVREPKLSLRASEVESFDLIIVPGVLFDSNCGRMGYGKGFYDELLKRISGVKVGVAYDFQVLDLIPSEKHDVRMDLVLTENGVYK